MYKTITYQDHHTGAYLVEGTGPTVVLLHGFAEDNSVWQYQIDYLSNRNKLIVPNFPGTGNADLNAEQLSIEGMADYINTILEFENEEQVIMIGHSMGGYVSLAFAEKYPSKLKGFGLFHSSALADTPEKISAREKSIRMIREYGNEAFIKQAIPNMFGENYKKEYPDLLAEYIRRANGIATETLIAYYEAMIHRPGRTKILQETTVPVLFIIGTDDNAVPLDVITPQTSLPMVSSIHVLQGVGHMGLWEDFEESNFQLQAFIDFCMSRS